MNCNNCRICKRMLNKYQLRLCSKCQRQQRKKTSYNMEKHWWEPMDIQTYEVPFEKQKSRVSIHRAQSKVQVTKYHNLGTLPSQLDLCKETLAIFAREKIDSIETLALLTEEDYKELKIPMGERKRLLKAFNK